MKKVKTTIKYSVPHWNFCNVDLFDIDLAPSPQKCRFCKPSAYGYTCMLYDEELMTKGDRVMKTHACCRATCGATSEIDLTASMPAPDPKKIMTDTINLYSKAVNSLVDKGYPRTMAEQAAKQYILGE